MLRKAVFFILAVLLAFPVLAEEAATPAFKLPGLNNDTISLQDYLGKQTVVLCFFTSWSKSCQSEILFLNGLAKENKKIKVIGISFDRKRDQLISFLKENGIDFDIAYDKKLQTLKDFRILIIPTLVAIDKAGEIKNVYVDFDENVEKAVREFIRSAEPPPDQD